MNLAGDVRFWQSVRLSDATAREAFEHAAARPFETPPAAGRGILIPGGGEKYLRGASHFVALARNVYTTNDRRAALKRAIDELVPSDTREYKTHPLPELCLPGRQT